MKNDKETMKGNELLKVRLLGVQQRRAYTISALCLLQDVRRWDNTNTLPLLTLHTKGVMWHIWLGGYGATERAIKKVADEQDTTADIISVTAIEYSGYYGGGLSHDKAAGESSESITVA